MNATLADLVGVLKSKGRIALEDVLAMRRAFYTPPDIATGDIEALASLDRAVSDRGPEWGDFFGGAVVGHHQQKRTLDRASQQNNDQSLGRRRQSSDTHPSRALPQMGGGTLESR